MRYGILLSVVLILTIGSSRGDEPKQEDLKPEKKLIAMNPAKTVLVDKEGKRVILKGKVVLREGALELLVCKKQTKEHEAILSVDGKAYVIHAALLAIGAVPGETVRFEPEFKLATGQEIDIFFTWTDEDGKLQRIDSRKWVRNNTNRFYVVKVEKLPKGVDLPEKERMRYDEETKELLWFGTMSQKEQKHWLKKSDDKKYQAAVNDLFDQSQVKEMDAKWVFAGSGFYVDEETKEKYYRAEDGDLICVANFTSAMIDVNNESTSQGELVSYEAYTERIPPIGTLVDIELIPVPQKKVEKEKKTEE